MQTEWDARTLRDPRASADFYERRYAADYMDDWNVEKKRRVHALVRGLGLPEHGDALDFGCGTGVFTEVVRQALPGWRVSGTDLSEAAVAKARARVPGCDFFPARGAAGRRFDFLFSHHVLEHVHDLPGAWEEVVGYLKPAATMLHILPCGNPGSFEHGLCLLKENGIDAAREGRFFYEDAGHLRRLTTEQMNALAARHGFALAAEYYANQRAGGVEWLTQSHPLRVLSVSNPLGARDAHAALRALAAGAWLLPLYAWRLPATVFGRVRRVRDRRRRHYAWLALCLPLLPFAWPLDRFLRRRAEREWQQRNRDRGGSEMYLYYTRPASPEPVA